MKRKWMWGAMVLGLTGLGSFCVAAAQMMPQRSVLSGTVRTVVPVGTEVKEGDVLVTVDTLAGPVPAVRSDTDGVVKEMKVAAGQTVSGKDIVAVVSTK